MIFLRTFRYSKKQKTSIIIRYASIGPTRWDCLITLSNISAMFIMLVKSCVSRHERWIYLCDQCPICNSPVVNLISALCDVYSVIQQYVIKIVSALSCGRWDVFSMYYSSNKSYHPHINTMNSSLSLFSLVLWHSVLYERHI